MLHGRHSSDMESDVSEGQATVGDCLEAVCEVDETWCARLVSRILVFGDWR